MKFQNNIFLKVNKLKVYALFIFSMFAFSHAYSGAPLLIITPLKTPLTTRSVPVQDSLANSTFHLDLKPYVQVIQHEISYQLNLHPALPKVYTAIGLLPLPPGISRVSDRLGDCPVGPITLGPNQKCTLRFYIDKKFVPSPAMKGPSVCLNPPISCYNPTPGQGFEYTVPTAFSPVAAQIEPCVQDGLTFNETTGTITGKPTRTGVYRFRFSAANGLERTSPHDLEVHVNVNPKDKPAFKSLHHTMLSAMPEHEYRVNLMELLESDPSFMVTNQISFHIDCSSGCPQWIRIDENEATLLQGYVPITEAGKTVEVRIIATSNTGGDSDPLTIKIPVASDPKRKPIIDRDIKLTGAAGDSFRNDFRSQITDPADDGSLHILIDKIEPDAPWLSKTSPTELGGVIPESAVGLEYQITMRATTTTGGNSEPVTIPLSIAINKDLTPRFYMSPQLPLFYVGQSYSYDFVSNRDVFPEYEDIPYTIELAEGYNNPSWVRIENNKLIVDSVPENLNRIEQLFITIKNNPGGKSNALSVKLFIMN